MTFLLYDIIIIGIFSLAIFVLLANIFNVEIPDTNKVYLIVFSSCILTHLFFIFVTTKTCDDIEINFENIHPASL